MPPPSHPGPAHPSVLSGYEELLEVAEAILHSVTLPPGVMEKYHAIQKEVKDRIRIALSRSPDPSASPAPSDDARSAVLAEKLAQSKRKGAELKAQVAALEGQLAQMTSRVQQLHAMHANSAAELVAQTKHACEAAAARVAEEAEARAAQEAAVARKLASDAIDAERAFHASLVRKAHTLQATFPMEYGVAEAAEPPPSSSSSSQPRAAPVPRLDLHAFFEATRCALNQASHLRRDLADAQDELRAVRLRVTAADAHRDAVGRAGGFISDTVAQLKSELLQPSASGDSHRSRSALWQQRDAIVAQVAAVERRMQQAREAKAIAAKSDADRGANRESGEQMHRSATRRSPPVRRMRGEDEHSSVDEDRSRRWTPPSHPPHTERDELQSHDAHVQRRETAYSESPTLEQATLSEEERGYSGTLSNSSSQTRKLHRDQRRTPA